MVVPSRTGLSAAVAAAVVLSVPVLSAGGLKAEERINWLKTPAAAAATTPLQGPPQLPSPPSLPPQTYRYRLAPGDRLVTSVFKIDGYEAQVQVLSDGTVNLPRLGTIQVWGLTLEEARQRITDGYSRFLRRPLVYVDLVEQRPVRVTVTGEVLRPGVFTLPVNSQGSIGSTGDATGVGADGGGWPTMIDVIQKAGGISAAGDLARLELLRSSPTPGGATQSYVFDYLTVLKDGGFAPNPLIYDGDSIRVHKATSPVNADLLKQQPPTSLQRLSMCRWLEKSSPQEWFRLDLMIRCPARSCRLEALPAAAA